MYYLGNVLYYQLNIDYIVDTYCVNKEKPQLHCNGKCHLAKQLAAINTTTTDKNDEAIMMIYNSFFPVFSESLTEIKIDNIATPYSRKTVISPHQIYSYNYDYSHFRPPSV